MTPYAGATMLETEEPTPTLEGPVNRTNATPTPTDAPVIVPSVTAAMAQSLTYELPPGAYGTERTPSPTETLAPLSTVLPQESAGSSSLPRWVGYLFYIVLGLSGVAALALVGSYVRSRPTGERAAAATTLRPAPPRTQGVRLLQPGSPGLSIDQQILIDLIAGFDPQSMEVDRLGRHLLRFEQGARHDARGRSVRLGRLVALSAIPSAPIPAPATAWARAHGFRVLAVDGSGRALVMPDLPSGGRSVLGVLPISAMVEGAIPVPMPVPPATAAGVDRAGA